jgi:hypothetical protein
MASRYIENARGILLPESAVNDAASQWRNHMNRATGFAQTVVGAPGAAINYVGNTARRARQAANTPVGRGIAAGAIGAGALAGVNAGINALGGTTDSRERRANDMFDNYVRDLETLNRRYQSQAQIEGIGDPTQAMNRQFQSDVQQAEVIQDLDVLGKKKLDDLQYQNEIRNQPLYALARGRDRLAGMSDRMNQYAIALANTSELYR